MTWMVWAAGLALGSPNAEWMARVTEAQIGPTMAIDCQPQGLALERAAAWFLGGNRAALPIPPEVWQSLRSGSERSRLRLQEDGHLRIAISDGGAGAFEWGFEGTTTEAEVLPSILGGPPMVDPVWENGALISVDGKPPPPGVSIWAKEGVLGFAMRRGASAEQGSIVQRVSTADPARDGCTLTMDLTAMTGNAPDGHLRMVFPFDASSPIHGTLHPREMPSIPDEQSAHAPPVAATTRVPAMVLAVRMTEAERASLRPLLTPDMMRPLLDLDAYTMAVYDGDVTAMVIVVPGSLAGVDLGKAGLLRLMNQLFDVEGGRLKRVRNGVYKSVGTPRTVYAGVRSRRVVFAREEAVVQELLEDRGTPWLDERDAAVARDVPLVVRINDLPMDAGPIPPLTLALGRGADHWRFQVHPDDTALLLRTLFDQGAKGTR
ncbi:MAG: hypothetical protein KTR31_04970 [Myxococcales bacterium]|nr:hypothetical protein [Myxococcales bacterium]